MKWIQLLGVTCFFLFLTGCSIDSSSSQKETGALNKEAQQNILTFINEDVQMIAQYEKKANKALAAVSGDHYENNEAVYTALVEEAIPAYGQAVEEVKHLQAPIEELQPMVEYIQQSISAYHEVLLLQEKGLKEGDPLLIDQAKLKADEYYQLVSAYHQEMKKLSEKHDIKYESYAGN
ncbi:hypothetical protein E2R51_11895 [Jeotgalibacillus sp. S-D1]|uniref:hypothetical protein n=1 Tax=Jeotgalibacillus sp. S-D1 TaxID=2552189 RepID=UPI00105A2171|nr:hypothetical protein [Jeotgalibacillus sp. S-D1]TDL31915.1 hypothetical protein E2R51_11895 [Jeotgalibacillus sp. S-D1]